MMQLKIISWNINGVHTKLEKDNVQRVLSIYDIICLNEVKTSLNVSFPGYIAYKSISKEAPHRGGTVVLIKSYLRPLIIRVDVSICDQVWIEIKSAPVVLFGFCYVPPSDSMYYSHEYFGSIQAKLKNNPFHSYL